MPNYFSSSKPGSDQSNIVDSTKPGFVSSYQKKTKETQSISEEAKNINTGKKLIKDTVDDALKEKTTKEQEKAALNIVKQLMKKGTRNFKAEDFRFSNMIFMQYDAKFKDEVYDKTPLILVLSTSRSYVLGLNLHWTPVPLRIALIKILFKMNKAAIQKNKQLKITYKMVKPLLSALHLGPVIRLYIKKRISRRGIIIPQDLWLVAARLRAESFSGGYSADKLYAKAIQNYKKSKSKNIRKNRKMF
ncbi:putative DNA end protector protein [Campylobacter phage vB_Cj_QDYZ]|uniref:DNA end protector protein n=2 Tax=Fletchervirus TaxID=1636618 RepID=A0AAF0GCJ4_9CAUD|nr:putative DNA end protector protein [Campylobacter phage F336]WGA02346.1 putative DNA end protector protein [Campylobacter phage vB_Cj_QDYZ]